MLRDGWNFHNDIAIALESIARKKYCDNKRSSTKIYDADSIELGNFAEVMIILLRETTEMENDHADIDNFVNKCGPYLGKSGNSIPKATAQELFENFKQLYY